MVKVLALILVAISLVPTNARAGSPSMLLSQPPSSSVASGPTTKARDFRQQQISGFIIRKSGSNRYFLKALGQEWIIDTNSTETAAHLQRMGDGDLLIGIGSFQEAQKVISLSAVDFVGLRRILGVWASSTDLVNFLDFQSMSLIRRNLPALRDESPERTENYIYTMSPASTINDHWILILSDDRSERLATMSIYSDRSILRLFDPVSGELVRELELYKL